MNTNELTKLTKVELHVHLDCCLSFDVVQRLKPGVTPDEYKQDFIAPAKCKDLADFLRVIDNSLALMQTRESMQWVCEDLFRQFQLDNVIYAEIRFAPFLHLHKGLIPEQVVETVEAEVSRMVRQTGIEARIILCTLRHFSEEQSLATARLVKQFRGTRVVALDLAANEAGFPIDPHAAAFEFANKHNIFRTAHAGEALGPESVKETLKRLSPTRIGHGVRSIEEPALLQQLIDMNVHLEVCPTCNVQIDVVDSYENHPIGRLFRAGVSLGINTDARTTTNITLSREYKRLHLVFGWGKEHFLACNLNALRAAFLPDNIKNELEQKLIGSYRENS